MPLQVTLLTFDSPLTIQSFLCIMYLYASIIELYNLESSSKYDKLQENFPLMIFQGLSRPDQSTSSLINKVVECPRLYSDTTRRPFLVTMKTGNKSEIRFYI